MKDPLAEVRTLESQVETLRAQLESKAQDAKADLGDGHIAKLAASGNTEALSVWQSGGGGRAYISGRAQIVALRDFLNAHYPPEEGSTS